MLCEARGVEKTDKNDVPEVIWVIFGPSWSHFPLKNGHFWHCQISAILEFLALPQRAENTR